MKKPHFKLDKKVVLTSVGVAVLLLAMLALGWLVWFLQNKENIIPQEPFNTVIERTGPQAAAEAQDLAVRGKTDEAVKKLQEAAKSTTNPEEKQKILLQEGVVYGNEGDYQKALQVYLEAEKVKSDFTISHLIGEAYEALGNKEKAIEYFKKAISQLTPGDTGYFMDKEHYEAKIVELGGQP